MGGISGFGLFGHGAYERLPRRLPVPRPVGELPDWRDEERPRPRRAAHSGRPIAGIPFRRRNDDERLDHRHVGHLLYAQRRRTLPERRLPRPVARPDRPGAIADRIGYTGVVRTRMVASRHVGQSLFRSARPGSAGHAARTAVAPEFRRHALRPRPAFPLYGQPGDSWHSSTSRIASYNRCRSTISGSHSRGGTASN